jgi:hypothetical protein
LIVFVRNIIHGHSDLRLRQAVVAREFERKIAAVREPSSRSPCNEAGVFECAAFDTPQSPSSDAAHHESPYVSAPLSEVSSASPQLAAAFGLASFSRDAGSRTSRSFSMDSPQMPTLAVILPRACIGPSAVS